MASVLEWMCDRVKISKVKNKTKQNKTKETKQKYLRMMLGFVSIGGDGVLGRFVRAKIATGTMLLLL